MCIEGGWYYKSDGHPKRRNESSYAVFRYHTNYSTFYAFLRFSKLRIRYLHHSGMALMLRLYFLSFIGSSSIREIRQSSVVHESYYWNINNKTWRQILYLFHIDLLYWFFIDHTHTFFHLHQVSYKTSLKSAFAAIYIY